MNRQITMFTDGAAKGNPGNGGYGTILISGEFKKEISEGYAHTTNNRMELLAVIVGLEALKIFPADITVYSDSSYVVNAVTKGWVFGWERVKFKNKKNPDLWIRFLKIYRQHNVKFVWVKGHAGNPLNERCDQLAVAAAMKQNLKIDTGYINEDQLKIQ